MSVLLRRRGTAVTGEDYILIIGGSSGPFDGTIFDLDPFDVGGDGSTNLPVTGGTITFVYDDSAAPSDETAPAPGGGYAPWEHGRLSRHERDAQKRKREEERRTIAELEAAYDKAQGLAVAVEAMDAPDEAETLSAALSVANRAILSARNDEAERSAQFEAVLADLMALAAEIEQRILDDEDDFEFLMMVA